MALSAAAIATAADPGVAGPPTARQVWADESTNLLGLPSRDGRLLSYVDPATGDLGIYDLNSGEKRLLTGNPPDAPTFAYFSVISPDNKRVAYAWFNERKFYELWITDIDGGEPRLLYSNPESGFVQPCDFSPDGSQILTLFFRKDNVSQIALVSAADGSVTTLKTLSWFYPKKMSFSPDGRYILYDSILSQRETPRDILLLRSDGSSETKLIENEANDIFPVWTPDGKAIVFASNRSGDMDLWVQGVEDGAAVGEPRRIARSLGRALPMGVTNDGRYFYGLRTGRSDVFVASLDGGAPAVAGLRTAGRNTAPAWAPDGKRLAYLTHLGTENYGRESRGIVIWLPETRQETVITPQLAYVSRLQWSPDGQKLLASGSDGKGRSGVYQVDPDSGATRPLVRTPGGAPGGFPGVWSHDGAAVLYVDPETSAIQRYSLADRKQIEVRPPPAHGKVDALALSHDGAWLAFVADGAIRIRNLASGVERELAREQAVRSLAWAPDGMSLFVGAPNEIAKVDLDGEVRPLGFAAKHDGDVRFDPSGRRVAYSLDGQRAEVWVLEGWFRP